MFSKHQSFTTSSFTGSGGSVVFAKSEGASGQSVLPERCCKSSFADADKPDVLFRRQHSQCPFEGGCQQSVILPEMREMPLCLQAKSKQFPFIISSLKRFLITFNRASNMGMPG
jgi:hypothetical protein